MLMEAFYASPFFPIYIIWAYSIQGLALWRAAKLGQRNWFIILLIFNPAGLLQLAYLFFFATKRLTVHEMKQWKNIFVKRVPDKE
jgi:hypothetical protein